MYYDFDISDRVKELAAQAEIDCAPYFREAEANAMEISARVLKAFRDQRVSTTDFLEVTGYGFSDPGREKLERLYAQVFGGEDALVRAQLMSGTHALAVAFGGLLKYGDVMLSISGRPYDTMCSIIGLNGKSRNSLMAHGIKYEEIDLIDSQFDLEAIRERVSKKDVRVVAIQRSRGYAHRYSLTIDQIGEAIAVVKEADPEAIVLVDNCYGDFCETREPTHVGADVIVGSMMKNLGAGVAVTGAYCVGRTECINDIAERFTAPCVGKDLGANMNQLTSFYKGIFLAPATVCASLKTQIFAARMLELAGFKGISPRYDEKRTDIVQTMDLETPENLVKFCCGIQHSSPIDSYVTPEAGPMPGYPHDEVMASGTFVTGATSELSCDGPICPPYTAYMQGGLTYEYGKLGIMLAIDEMLRG